MTALRARWTRGAPGDRVAAPFDRFVALGVALAFPLRFEERAVGLLLVGDKLSAAVYTDEDLDLVQTLANQRTALVNARAAEVIRIRRPSWPRPSASPPWASWRRRSRTASGTRSPAFAPRPRLRATSWASATASCARISTRSSARRTRWRHAPVHLD